MKISDKGLELIKKFEGFRDEPYLCSAGVPTIGYGTTRYPNGAKVKLADPQITHVRAKEFLLHDVEQFEKDVTQLIGATVLTQNQFDALVCLAYNIGSDIDLDDIAEGLGDSTLLKKVKKNPIDPTIEAEFGKWVYAKGRKVNGLIARRKSEAELWKSK